VCEPTGGLVHQAIIEANGSGYKEKDGGNIFAASDEWVSPVEAKTGPDGAVWVLDWYNFIVQHNPTPTEKWGGFDAENGDGNAYVNPLRDKSHGRIWRIVPKNAKQTKVPELRVDDPNGLVAALKNDNMFWRLTAQRLLVESKATEVTESLVAMVKDKSTDDMGLAPSALHALWTLDGLGLISNGNGDAIGAARSALFHPAPSLRRAAIQILEKVDGADELIFNSGALDDEDPTVQLAAMLFFAGNATDIELGEKLYQLLQVPAIQEDKWRGYAIYSAATHHLDGFINAFLADHPDFDVKGEIQDDQPLDERFTLAYFSKRKVESSTSFSDLGPATKIVIGTVENEMKYSVTAFEVEAGQPVELVFDNTDFMQHNLLILKPGTKEKVGTAADKMASANDAAERNYTPDMEEILYSIKLLNPEEKYTLKFIAPEEPGIYPYICTFPGHWRLMQGNMKVVPAKKVL
jgi:azurin